MRNKTSKDYPLGRDEQVKYMQTIVAIIILAVGVGYLIGKWLFS